MPDILNWFGWCTWDAFYTEVDSDGVKKGLERCVSISMHIPQLCLILILEKSLTFEYCSFESGGIPPKFVIIDDGWQSVAKDSASADCKADNTAK